jgi:membrane-bound lytic murein transglycosylase D
MALTATCSAVAAPVPPNLPLPESRKSALLFHPSIEVSNPLLQKRIYFWKKVFSWYGPRHVILHHTRYPWIVYKIISLNEGIREVRRDYSKREWWETRLREEIYKQRAALYQLAVKLQQNRALTEEESKLLRKFRGLPPNSVAEATRPENFRAQRGMKEDFERALNRAALALPEMQNIFEAHSTPPELTRLPFVESMFNPVARSHVGALGLWQLMPDTARMYGLRVGQFGDDRLNPTKSTTAAARFLRDYFRELKAWPLAITAYNHGIRGVRQAVGSLQTRDLSQIIHGYRGPAFGFAAQNFFSEFMAALELELFPGQYFLRTAQEGI